MSKSLVEASMLSSVTLLVLLCVCNAEYTVKCNNGTQKSLSMESAQDEVKSRYVVEWCTSVDRVDTKWNLILSYNTNLNKTRCRGQSRRWNKHSEINLPFNGADLNCTNVCLQTTLDLIFTGCYYMESWLPAMGSIKDTAYPYISNQYTIESFLNSKSNADVIYHGDYVAVHWHFGNITATVYNMELCKIDNITNISETHDCWNINDNCTITSTATRNSILCNLYHLQGKYKIHLKHLAPWKSGSVFIRHAFVHVTFSVAAVPPPALRGAGGGAGGAAWLGAAAALAAAAAAATALCHCRAAAALRKRVLRAWQRWTAEKYGAECGAGAPLAAEPVLLLYARDQHAQPLHAALADLLRAAPPGEVIDLYSPAVTAAAAPAPAAWLRARLRSPRLRLVLLQTPALAPRAAPRRPPARPPARPPRDPPRDPLPGDALLSLALRLLSEGPPRTDAPYNKYFLATVSALPTEALPDVVPFRRYALPEHARRLLLDVAGGEHEHEHAPHEHEHAPHEHALDDVLARLAHAAAEFAEHARRADHLYQYGTAS